MPNFEITSTPVRLSQTITNTSLLTNNGASIVFLDASSSVNDLVYGLAMAPRQQVVWPANKELWAVTAPNTTSNMAVLYDAEGASASEVSIDGPVDVDLLNPVNVQGGGTELLSFSGDVQNNSTNGHSVMAPANGLTYYGLLVFLQYSTGGAADDAISVDVFNHGTGVIPPPTSAVVLNGASHPDQAGSFGRVHQTAFIVPVTDSYPINIDVSKFGGTGATDYILIVRGISQSLPYPVDAMQWADNHDDDNVNLDNLAAGQLVYFAPSFQDLRFRFTALSATAGNFTIDAHDTSSGWYETENRPQIGYLGGTVPTGTIESPSKSEFIIPGNGRPHRLRCITAVTGGLRLSYAGRAS